MVARSDIRFGESATVDHIVHRGRATVRAIAAPRVRVRIEPEAGGVVVVECGTSCLDPGDQASGSGGAALTGRARGRSSTRSLKKGKKGAGEGRVKGSDGDEGRGRQRCPERWIEGTTVQAPQVVSSRPSPVAERSEGAKKKPRAKLANASPKPRCKARGVRSTRVTTAVPRLARQRW